jgi:signal transduction histidine kinase
MMEQTPAGPTGESARSLDRELDVAREVAHALLTAATPLEVYRLALGRLTPLVCAGFSSVFERDPADPALLKLACAHNWPQASARFLSQLRIRVGRGPTGRAVAEGELVQVRDVFADLALREWWEPARELGFVALISLPLRVGSRVDGALTFYFTSARDFDDSERHLLVHIADQLAAASGRVAEMDAQRREMARLQAENDQLRGRLGAGEESTRLKDEFLSNISHELRTPLTAILGYADLLAGGHAGDVPEEQRAGVERIRKAAHALLRLINDLLELSHLKLGRVELSVAPDDALHIAQRALDAAGPPPDDVQVAIEEPAERIHLLVDGEKAARILENLLTNAFKFTPRGSVTVTIRRTVEEQQPIVEWVVRDTGIGIPADDHDAIFDEFRQVDGSSTRLYAGTGLGLALSRRLARLLGGRITVRSEPGRGSEFRLAVPAH